MRHARSYVLLVPFVCAPGCAFYCARFEIPGEETLDAEGVKRVIVETANGHVRVRSADGLTSAVVRYRRFARGRSSADAREGAERVQVVVERDPSDQATLRVSATVPRDLWGRSAGAEMNVDLPAGVDLEARTSNGRIGVEGMRGDVTLKTSNGGIDVRDVRGDVNVHSANGGVRLERVAGGIVSAVTSNGGIQAMGISGEPRLRTSNGAIVLRLKDAPAHPRIEAVTSNGSVLLEVPASVNARLSLRTSNGAITRNLDGCAVSDLESSKRRVRTTLNGGGGEIDVETSNGAIDFQAVR